MGGERWRWWLSTDMFTFLRNTTLTEELRSLRHFGHWPTQFEHERNETLHVSNVK